MIRTIIQKPYLLVLALLVCCPLSGWSFASSYTDLVDVDQWPEDHARLTRHGSFVAGYHINADDFQFYTGTTESLSALLADYARTTNTSHTVVRHPGIGKVEYPWKSETDQTTSTVDKHNRAGAPADWCLNRYSRSWRQLADPATPGVLQPGFDITIDVWTGGGRIDWNDVIVPEGIEVRDALPKPSGTSEPK